MAETRYIFANPEQIKEISRFLKRGNGNVQSVARVWSVQKRKSGTTIWDGKIGVVFRTSGKERRAEVFRVNNEGKLLTLAWLKYAPALAWCREHAEELTCTG